MSGLYKMKHKGRDQKKILTPRTSKDVISPKKKTVTYNLIFNLFKQIIFFLNLLF